MRKEMSYLSDDQFLPWELDQIYGMDINRKTTTHAIHPDITAQTFICNYPAECPYEKDHDCTCCEPCSYREQRS